MEKASLIRWIGHVPGVNHALRWYAHQYSEGSLVPIRCGHAVGLQWKRYHRYVNGFWIGQYELDVQSAIVRLLRPGGAFFDVGANAGFFTLVAGRVVGSKGSCVAFDPLPENCRCIREQMELNEFHHCRAVRTAIGKQRGTATVSFSTPGSSTAHVGIRAVGERQLEVDVMTLDDAADKYGSPCLIKMDIEGAEADALMGAGRLLRQQRPSWLIELHGTDCEQSVRETLANARYRILGLQGSELTGTREWPRHIVAVSES